MAPKTRPNKEQESWRLRRRRSRTLQRPNALRLAGACIFQIISERNRKVCYQRRYLYPPAFTVLPGLANAQDNMKYYDAVIMIGICDTENLK